MTVKTMSLNINGQVKTITCDDATPLLWVLRDILGMTGTKYGCGVEICKACTVWIDGSAEKSCLLQVKEVLKVKLTTIEGLSATKEGRAMQKAWIDNQVPQCGYCQSGVLMCGAKLAGSGARPTDTQINSAISNICACGTYPRIREAIKHAWDIKGTV